MKLSTLVLGAAMTAGIAGCATSESTVNIRNNGGQIQPTAVQGARPTPVVQQSLDDAAANAPVAGVQQDATVYRIIPAPTTQSTKTQDVYMMRMGHIDNVASQSALDARVLPPDVAKVVQQFRTDYDASKTQSGILVLPSGKRYGLEMATDPSGAPYVAIMANGERKDPNGNKVFFRVDAGNQVYTTVTVTADSRTEVGGKGNVKTTLYTADCLDPNFVFPTLSQKQIDFMVEQRAKQAYEEGKRYRQQLPPQTGARYEPGVTASPSGKVYAPIGAPDPKCKN